MEIFDCTGLQARHAAIEAAVSVVRAGHVVCLPTDTVYGIGADPFNDDAVTELLAAKSRTRQMPPPVLVHDAEQASTLTAWINDEAMALMENLWPGALTIILPARENIGWDLGETQGTVALRMPDNSIALELLEHTGPLAVTSANKTGRSPATNITQAYEQLGDAVGVYLDGGEAGGGVPSTIIKFSPESPRKVQLIRAGAISAEIIESTANVQVIQ
ncbi:L-threonylcarbamoyladenylate synthase [Arcanobacterium bovis]|uniref:L-threonylcarbamoyladenylate synthase n=1 Tax=Arcanobacterium bovis TaxID=2529275 RepID=A0A4Q9UZU9_9ACTO|nr:L-threonylcarbamoyladenylate synthase [Arcanobacterium bovis]TBW21565.1 threonylcarbamoyl-AMP synthase [Arcanobacterium bovis]